MLCPTFKIFREFFENSKEKTMQVSKETFDTYLQNLQECQRQTALVSDGLALWFGLGGKRYIKRIDP
jgi:hypothetical protein